MQAISAFFGIAKVADFWCKNADVSRTHKSLKCHVIYIVFGSSLGKLQLC